MEETPIKPEPEPPPDSGNEADLEKEAEEELAEEEEEEQYNSEDFISQPYLSEYCTLPENIVNFDYSFGYDCKRYFNLCVVDKEVLIFASGNLIHLLNSRTGEKWYRRCFSGEGIGHITTNPKEPHIAVGEKGENPLIIIYKWPSFEIVTILKRGTKKAYSHLNYSPDGELLCSQGSYPDYMLTIWNWKKHRIMLRAKAYGQEVFNSRFSLYVPGHLTSSGVSHIKFWKINQTFTGLKLQGELGRFGKSEICNIVGFLALPDEKVVSGCEWGNILVWDAGLIRVEVFRRGKNYCHEAPITQLIYNNGELTTVAMDGTIKVWYYETIELADPPDEERYIEVEPIFEFEIGDYYHKAQLMIIVKCDPDDPDDNFWFGQDGNGGIWKLDLSTALSAKPPHEIFQCHAGEVAAIQASPFSTHLASLGKDGRLLMYDYKLQKTVLRKEFLLGGRSLLWLPLNVEATGTVLIGGFEDGVIRIVSASLQEYMRKVPSPSEEYINLIQVAKPHTKAVTVITINPKGTIVVTGSEDSTIFVFKVGHGIQYVELLPIGYAPVSGPVSSCAWKPDESATLLVACTNGTVMEMELPETPISADPRSYLLTDLKMEQLTFVSVKSEIRRNLRIAELEAEKEAKLNAKRKEFEKLKEEDAALDEETFFGDDEDEEPPVLPEIYIPEVPSPILFATYTPKGTIWLSMAGYDAGYMYEYQFGTEGPVKSTLIKDADDIEIQSYHYYFNNKYLILGMHDGKIRICRINPNDHTDLSDYWSYAMHDPDNGIIYQICFNNNYKYLFTCGSDGNIFSYIFNPEDHFYKDTSSINAISRGFPFHICSDIDDTEAMSLEQTKNKIEHDERLRLANAYKTEILETLKGLEKEYEAILKRNQKLPESQQLTHEELTLDERIIEDMEENLRQEMDLVQRKIAWPLEKSKCQFEKLRSYFIDVLETQTFRVHGIDMMERFVETFRLNKFGPEFEKYKELVLVKLEEQEAKGRAQAKLFAEEEIVEVITRRPNPVDALLKQIMTLCGDYKKNIKLRRLLRNYRERKDRLETRRIEWHEMMMKRPDPNKPDPEDMTAIENARDCIGDYKLKTSSDYKVPKHLKITTVSMYDVLLKTREAIQKLKRDYNEEVLNLRDRKMKMIERHEFLRETLLEISKEIPAENKRDPPELPTYDEDIEFPEKKLMWTEKGVFEELPKRYQKLYKTEIAKKKEIKMLDKEYEMLILEKRGQKLGKIYSKLNLMKYSGIATSGDIKELEETGKDDQVSTPWEKECRKLRLIKRLYQQDGIIDEMETAIREFDEDIFRLHESKLRIEVDIKFLELYLLTVHQEVLILKKFEAAEEEKENNLFEKLTEKHEIQKKMNEINNRVEARNREIRRCEEEIKNLVTTYHAAIADNKFFDFLRRIFKKKYRPPKVKSEDSESESESESESSSEEDETKSLDSKDIGPIRLDENVCPPGCDTQLYEWTFKQRSARHELELTIIEEKRHVELHKKDYESLMKKIKFVESQYLICKRDLEEFMREKQRNLNEIQTIVILRLSQIQNFKKDHEMEKIKDSVIFSAQGLSNLYKRVGELEKETELQKQKHAKNQQHLQRMKIDIKHMREVIIRLNNEINEVMLRKFGVKIDIDDLEESLLKRMVAEMHGIVLDLERQLDKNLKSIRDTLIEKKETYSRKMQENTERYNLLTVLQEEKTKLQQLLLRQEKVLCAEPIISEKEQQNDIEKLTKVAKLQEERIATLKLEIKMLKYKVKPTTPAPGMYSSEALGSKQRIIIRGCDGEIEEITAETRDELKDIYEETQEIVQDLREGDINEEDVERLRKLTGEFIERLPSKCQAGVVSRLSMRSIVDEEDAKQLAEGIIMDIVRNIRTESFLETTEMMADMVESIMPQFDDDEDDKK